MEGNYTVSLIAEKFDPDSYDAKVRTFYIHVGSLVTADFSATPTSGLPPFSVQFTDHSSGGPTNWSWDFGDGTTSFEQNPVHVYNAIGNFNVTLTASTLYRSGSHTKVCTSTRWARSPPTSRARPSRSRSTGRSSSRTSRPGGRPHGSGTSATAPPRRCRTRPTVTPRRGPTR